MKKIVLLLITYYLPLTTLFAQSWVWGRNGSRGSDTWGVGIDSNTNVFLAGAFIDSISFGNNHLHSTSSMGDAYLVKYDSNGNIKWATQSNSVTTFAGVHGLAVATDNTGNVYVTGQFFETVQFGSLTLTSLSGGVGDFFLIKYDANGNAKWGKQSWSDGAWGSSATVDVFGDIYVTGTFHDSISFGTVTLKSRFESDMFLAKYDGSGNLLWAKQSNVPTWRSIVYGNSVATDVLGNVFVTGNFGDTAYFGPYTLLNNSGGAFLAKYDGSGNVQWAKQSKSNNYKGNAIGTAVIADKANNVYITGSFQDTNFFGSHTLICNPANYSKVFFVKYSSSGNVIWAKESANSSLVRWGGYSLAIDASNQLYFTCGTGDSYPGLNIFIFCNDTIQLNNTGDATVIMRIDTAGNSTCGAMIRTGGDDANTVVCDRSGKYIYLGGDIADTITFGNDFINNRTFEMPFIARWQPCTNRVAGSATPDYCEDFVVPNIFTPNGDGINDYFDISDTTLTGYSISIYDRWGQLEFYSTNVNISWDGRNNAGVEVSDGVYYYIIKASCGGNTYNKKGFLHLIR